MTKIVYLDRNVLGDIRQQLFYSFDAYNTILKAIRAGRITIPVSLSVLEETLPVIKTNSSYKKVGDLQLIKELFDWRVGIRSHNDLLNGDIRAYANNASLPPRGLELDMSPEDLLAPQSGEIAELIRIVEETKKQTSENLKRMEIAKEVFKKKYGDERGRVKIGKDVTFKNLWDRLSVDIAASAATQAGVLRECKIRGLEGLLNLRTVRMYVGYSIAYGLEKFILDKKLTEGDSRDHHHTVQASVASIFVTHDMPLTKLLGYVPMTNFHVVNLDGLVHWLKCREQFYEWDYLDFGIKMSRRLKERMQKMPRKKGAALTQ